LMGWFSFLYCCGGTVYIIGFPYDFTTIIVAPGCCGCGLVGDPTHQGWICCVCLFVFSDHGL
jgi:hypothetical protein